MTAEVAILNKQAVALAADSAVTINIGPREKIYNTVNKLFTLSKEHPVGAMVYSSGEIMGVPAETVVKHFRSTRGSATRATLQQYATDFQEFLHTDHDMFPVGVRLKQFRSVIISQTTRLGNAIDRRSDEDTEAAFRKARSSVLADCAKSIRGLQDLPMDDEQSWKALEAELIESIKPDFMKFIMHEESPMDASEQALVAEILIGLANKRGEPSIPGLGKLSPPETGIVIAGFGDKEHFPALSAYEFVYSFGQIHRYTQNREYKAINDDLLAIMMPFAQTDMVRVYMDGKAEGYDRAVTAAIRSYCDDRREAVKATRARRATKERGIASIDEMQDELLRRIAGEIGRWSVERWNVPIMSTVAVLPKHELAVLAQSLVNLTIQKKHTSQESETVGPPVDVAIISKGDGFVWIDRKHYFKPEMNPQFFANNYPRGVQ